MEVLYVCIFPQRHPTKLLNDCGGWKGGRSLFLRAAVVGREADVPSLNVRLTGFPPNIGEASDDFLLCTCKPLSSLAYTFPISVYSIYFFSVRS
jgi:hypothetical protein